MSRSSHKLFNFILFAFLYFQVRSLSLLRNTSMNAHTTSSGIIELQKDSTGTFYANADLVDLKTGRADTVKMMISIPNNDSLVATNCLYFEPYDCSKYHCKQENWGSRIEFPSFTASTMAARGSIYLDYDYWGLTSSYMHLAELCTTRDSPSNIGLNRYGVLGLGTGEKDYFMSSKRFSIYIESDLSKGKLLFKNETSKYAQSSSPLYTFKTNSTWELSLAHASIQVEGCAMGFDNPNLVFDINSDAIGLPESTYQLFLNSLPKIPGVRCGSEKYKPTCSYDGKIQDLPDITLWLDGKSLAIPSKIYATLIQKEGSESSFALNFRATSPSLVGKSYVTPRFKDSIILDANFMSYYYTIFDATSGENNIYLYISIDANSDPNNILWIISGSAGLILLVGLCFCYAKKKKSNASADNITNMTQAPLISNQQGGSIGPNYSSGSTVYNYPGYHHQSPEAYNIGAQGVNVNGNFQAQDTPGVDSQESAAKH